MFHLKLNLVFGANLRHNEEFTNRQAKFFLIKQIYSRTFAAYLQYVNFLCKYGEVYKEKLGGAWIVSLHAPTHIELYMGNKYIS
ncbi:hypothetical protein Anas_03135, partial [Armadillidium nasatum]